MNSFYEKCYAILKKVPKGKVTTYKEIAQALNSKAYRAVGTAMNKNPYAPIVPCHRVINSNGELGGFAERFRGGEVRDKQAGSRVSGLKNKIKLLKSEGIEIKNNKINLDKYFYKLK
jgi:methylated-DNA-[protein]-cysteine S-methyltransferase